VRVLAVASIVLIIGGRFGEIAHRPLCVRGSGERCEKNREEGEKIRSEVMRVIQKGITTLEVEGPAMEAN
jgi:hypothetical protein